MSVAGTPPADAYASAGDRAMRARRQEGDSDTRAEELSLLLASLECLSCRSSALCYAPAEAIIACTDCGTHYPVFRSGSAVFPWLLANPDGSRLQWKARYHGFLHSNSLELERLRSARSAVRRRPQSRARIGRLLQAREQYRSQVVELLAPFELEHIDWPADTTSLLEDKLPHNQGLSSYVTNAFRDWAWDNGENDALFEAVSRVLDADPRAHIGSLLVLGAGACRLSYDVHRRCSPTRTINVDINPLLLSLGTRVANGEIIPLYEFPLAPLDGASCAVLQECRAPVALNGSAFYSLVADAADLPLAADSVDTVLTPWLIDILPQDLRTFLPQLNRCLSAGGLWLNTGSLAFFHRDEAWCYSEEELLELLDECGFEVLRSERRTVSYLRSPHSAHGRTEDILSFVARKVQSVPAPTVSHHLPRWLRDNAVAVPASNEIELRSSNHLLTAQILAAIDGKKTVNQIGRKIARQYGLGLPETLHAVRQVLLNAWETACRQPGERHN